jgi:membrane AbrB-like protein
MNFRQRLSVFFARILPASSPHSPSRTLLLWVALLLTAALFGLLLSLAGLPAPVLIGSLVAGIAFAVNGMKAKIKRPLFLCAQGVIGVLVASSLTHGTVGEVGKSWPVFLVLAATTLLFAVAISWVVSRVTDVPSDAALWGGLPGMASSMVAGAYESGADSRLVAFFQYVRVAEVMLVASLVSHYLAHAAFVPLAVLPRTSWAALPLTLLIAVMAIPASKLRWVPAAPILVTIGIGSVVQLNDVAVLAVPPWLLLMANMAVGLQIGLCFTRETVWHVLRLIPAVVLSATILIALSAGTSYVLAVMLGIDHLTAFLATAPGSIDLIAIIAISNHIDVSFVMALQTTRLLMVVLLGPFIARSLQVNSARLD